MNYSTPKVTVLIPVYNGELYIKECVDSILNQSFTSFELILINDGSTDLTESILSEYARVDKRVMVVCQPNSGIVAALNNGLSLARGEFIARMDADDVAHQERLEEQVQYMTENEGCVVCGSNYELIGAAHGYVRVPDGDKNCRIKLFMESCFAHPTVMIRKSVLKSANIKYELDYQYAEDYRFWTRLADFGALGNIQKSLLKYRVHPGQISTSKQNVQRKRHAAVMSDHIKKMKVNVSADLVEEVLWPQLRGLKDSFLLIMRLGDISSRILRSQASYKFQLIGNLVRYSVSNAIRNLILELRK